MKTKLFLLFLSSTLALLAQGERGTLNGTIADPSGSVIAGATVKAVNIATNVETDTKATAAGVYRMPLLQPGTYRLAVTAQGFKTAVRENVAIGVAQTLTIDFSLELGAISDSITVSSEAPQIETGTAEIGSYVSKKEFDTWPITVGDGRRQIQQFIFTSLPGAVGDTFQGSINGGQNYSHEILIDGIALGRMDLQGGSNNEFSPSAESVSEFKLQTGTTSAQYSGGQTAVANFATKSGTNDLHGSAYYYVQNDALRANGFNNNASGIKRQPFKQNNYGFSAAGPVYLPKIYHGRNRTFFYGGWERTKVKNFTSTSFTTLPVPDFKQGNFSRLFSPSFTGNANSGTTQGTTDASGQPVVFGAIYDPASTQPGAGAQVRTPFAGNIIPRSRWSQVSQKILELAPIDDPLFDTMLNNIPAIGTSSPVFDEKMLTLKGDHNFSSSHRVSGLFNRNWRARNNSPNGRWGVPPGTPTDVYQWQSTPGTLVRASYDWTIRPVLLNHFAAGYNRFGNNNESVYVDQNWPAKIGVLNVPGTHFPTLLFAGQPYQGGNIGSPNAASGGYGRLGSANRGGSFNGSTIFQDDVTWVRGKHNFKFGFEHRRYYYNTRNKSGSGEFRFSPDQTAQPGFLTQTGHSFASFLLGAVKETSRPVSPSNFGHRWRSEGFYFQDDWKATRNLTLNLGLRWEVVGGLIEVAGRMSGIDFSAPNAAAGNLPGSLVFVDDLGRKGFQDTYWKQLSPKFGFAYAINEKLVMRGGYGINNTPPISNGFGFGGTLGFNSSIALNSGNTALPYPEAPIMYLQDPYPSFVGTLPNKSSTQGNGMSVDWFPANGSRLPYVQNWNLGFQYQLPAAIVLEANYIGNKGTRLIAKGYSNPNAVPFSVVQQYGDLLPRPWTGSSPIPAPYSGFTGTNLQALRPFPQFTGINDQTPNLGTSSYNSFQLQLTRHFRNGFSLLGAYTFSKAISLTDSAIDSENIEDVFNRKLERSVTNYDFPQFVKVTWIYELPVGPNKLLNVGGLTGKVIGGWQLSGIHQFRSGAHLAITTGGVTNPIGAVIRPDIVLGQNLVSNSDAPINFRGTAGGVAYLNRAAFTNPPVFPGGQNVVQHLGSAPPYLPDVRDAAMITENLSVYKQFKFTESRAFELRGTFLNPLNRHGRGGLDLNITSPFFGQFTGQQQGGRNVELAARVTF
jgi:hypothetical protein